MRDRRSRREGPDDDAAHDVTQDEGLAQHPRQRAADQSGAEDVGEVTDEEGVGYHAVVGVWNLP